MVLRTGRKLSAILLVLLAAFALALTPALAASAHDESEEIRLTNQARYENGQAGLIENSSLDSVALAWAQQLAANNVLSQPQLLVADSERMDRRRRERCSRLPQCTGRSRCLDGVSGTS